MNSISRSVLMGLVALNFLSIVSVSHADGFNYNTSVDIADPKLDEAQAIEKPYAFEIGGQFFGDTGNPSVISNGDAKRYRSSDSLFQVTGRKSFSNDFDLSLTIPIYTHITNQEFDQDSAPMVWVRPYSVAARYHFSFFGDQIRPFIEAGAGEALITERDSSSGFPEQSYFRFFGRFNLGADFALGRKSNWYIGLNGGYLAIKEYASFTTGISLGCRL